MRNVLLPCLALGLVLLSTSRRPAEIPLTTTRVASGSRPPSSSRRLRATRRGSSSSTRARARRDDPDPRPRVGHVLTTPVLTVTGVDHSGSNERGLLGMAFHPDYATNGYFYVYLSRRLEPNQIRRYTVSANPNVADPASMQIVMTMADPFSNHNGGWMGFGPRQLPLVACGDGGSGNDPLGNAQNKASLLGKILRLDVDNDAFPGDPNTNYAIPAGNPFAGAGDPGADEVFHYGLRNPWRDSFDRLTGDLYIGDVGQNAFEELDRAPAGSVGLNFGWACMEANSCRATAACTCNDVALTPPIHSYPLYVGGTLAIMGGYVYRGTELCGMQGTYFFADYGSGAIWSTPTPGPVHITTRTTQLDPPGTLSIASISSFGEDANGELYICDRSGGEVFKIVPGALVDCNLNGIQDACDIESGTSVDGDADGVPDECDNFQWTKFCIRRSTASGAARAGIRRCPRSQRRAATTSSTRRRSAERAARSSS
jgi:glucose/arabinose dehydrogenase